MLYVNRPFRLDSGSGRPPPSLLAPLVCRAYHGVASVGPQQALNAALLCLAAEILKSFLAVHTASITQSSKTTLLNECSLLEVQMGLHSS